MTTARGEKMQVGFKCKFGLASGLALLFAGPASAIDLTGSWAGTTSCLVYVDGAPLQKSTGETTVRISQTGSQLAADVDGLPFAGTVLEDGAKPEKGVASLVRCSTAATSPSVPTDLYVMNVQANADKGSAKGSAITTWITVGIGGKCSVKLKRTETTDPDLQGCN